MNIHGCGRSCCETAINHFKNVCTVTTFTIHILEKLPGNGYKSCAVDSQILEHRLGR